MFTWAKVISIVNVFLGLVQEFTRYVNEQKAIAQGKAELRAKQRAEEDERIAKAARARDELVVSDGMQPVDVSRAQHENDPYNRDNWKK